MCFKFHCGKLELINVSLTTIFTLPDRVAAALERTTRNCSHPGRGEKNKTPPWCRRLPTSSQPAALLVFLSGFFLRGLPCLSHTISLLHGTQATVSREMKIQQDKTKKKNISKKLLPNTQVKSSCQDFKSYSSIQFLVPHRWLFVGSTHYSWRDPPLLLDSWAFWAPKSEETVVSDLKALGWDPNSCPQKVWNVPPSLRLFYYLGAFKNRSTRLSMHMSSSAFANWPCSKGGSFMTWNAPVSCEWISSSPSFRRQKDQKKNGKDFVNHRDGI